MPPSYREEATSIRSPVFLDFARKVLAKLIRKNTEISRAVGKNEKIQFFNACLRKNTNTQSSRV